MADQQPLIVSAADVEAAWPVQPPRRQSSCERITHLSYLASLILILFAAAALCFYRGSFWAGADSSKLASMEAWEVQILAYLYWIVCATCAYIAKELLWLFCNYLSH